MSAIVAVSGPVAPSALHTGVVGGHLVARLPVQRPETARDAWFYEQTVSMAMLGDLMMGRANRDDAALEQHSAQHELERYAEVGGQLVVETTLPHQHRSLASLARLSHDSGVHVVASAAAQADAGAIVGELTAASSTGARVRAGLITLHSVDGAERVRGAGRAAADTSAPVLVLVDRSEPAPAALGRARRTVESLRDHGVAAERIAVGDVGAAAADPPALSDLAETGVRLLFDGLGRIPTIRTLVSDHDIAVVVADMVARGFADRVLLGVGLDRKHAFTDFGGHGLTFVRQQYLPYLGMLGVDEAQLARLAGANLASFLTWSKEAA